jgi:LuxR family transcriptional regulator
MGPGRTTRIAALLREMDDRSPAGLAVALHIDFTAPRYLVQSYPRQWLDHYSTSGLVLDDPTVRWGLGNIGCIRWGDLGMIDDRGVLEQARDFGIMNGVTLAIVEAGSRSIASFARSDRDFDDGEIRELERHFSELHRLTLDQSKLTASEQRALIELSVQTTRAHRQGLC